MRNFDKCHQNRIERCFTHHSCWLRFTMGIILLGIAVVLRRQLTLPDKKEWPYFALLGFLGITFHQWLQSNGLQTSEAGTTAWIVSTTPVFMALLGWFLLKERPGWSKNLGILLAFLGVLVVVSQGNFGSLSIAKFGAPGDVLILISAVNWAVFSALARRGLKSHPASLMMFYRVTRLAPSDILHCCFALPKRCLNDAYILSISSRRSSSASSLMRSGCADLDFAAAH
ncbi:MAG TPA: DMT family transporter [Anaerolineales bacterium]|nr:DMT family transporter [Anaerolineales bacterium]